MHNGLRLGNSNNGHTNECIQNGWMNDATNNNPVIGDVRDGIVYGPSAEEITGTMVIPAVTEVLNGVAVDVALTGTAVQLTAADVWDVPITGLTIAGSIGERLKNAATVDSMGAQVAALE